jgi:Fic family protein
MRPSDFTELKSGQLVKRARDWRAKGESDKLPEQERNYWAFVPNPLPPPLELTWELAGEISAADRALSELAGVTRTLPNPRLLIRPFMSREAVLSSRIEGTQASLSDLFYLEAANKPPTADSDVREVRNYVLALEHGLKRLDESPLCLRLLREMHEELMRGVRGEHLTPGEFRTRQNWIGPDGCNVNEARFVPPPIDEMNSALGEMEKFWHAQSPLPLVVRLALVHYQFEAIHPFLDGNGRIGRLLIILMLCAEKALPQPMLYLSAYFERNRQEYYRLLLAVSQDGRWAEWVSFFLRGVAEQSRDAIARSEKLLALWKQYRERLQSARSSALLLKLVDRLFGHPYLTVVSAQNVLRVTYRTANLSVQKLVKARILEELDRSKYGRIFVATEIFRALESNKAEKS